MRFTKPKKTVGLDIGSHAVQAVQMSRSGATLFTVVFGTPLVAPIRDEATPVRLAAKLEQARPWADRRPPVSATAVSA